MNTVPEAMRAVCLRKYGEPEDLVLERVRTPIPADDEVLIKVVASSINDWDWSMARGKPSYIRLFAGLSRPKVGIPGVDVAGVVVAAGRQVTRWTPGDRVFGDLSGSGFGAIAEYTTAFQNSLEAIPDGVRYLDAAAVPHAGAIAWQALVDVAVLGKGDRLLVNGAGGGVGAFAVQLAAEFGVDGPIAVDSGSKSSEMIRWGYSEVIDYRAENFTTRQGEYDVVLDVKSYQGLGAYTRSLVRGGRYISIGGGTPSLIKLAILGPVYGRLRGRTLKLLNLRANSGLAELADLMNAGKLKPRIDSIVSLAEVPGAIRRFGEGQHTGKIVVSVSG